MKSIMRPQVAVFVLLVAIGVLGRFAFVDTPNFTPTAAAALFAGYFFSSRLAAGLVPVTILALSNLWLPSYEGPTVMAAVYLAMLLPVVLGRRLRGRFSLWRLGLGATVPAVAFFAATNFAVWLSTGLYPHTAAGLTECYFCAIPFFRWMFEGDLLFVSLVFGSYAFARGACSEGPLWRRFAESRAAAARRPASR